jgi:hypothetical protein
MELYDGGEFPTTQKLVHGTREVAGYEGSS